MKEIKELEVQGNVGATKTSPMIDVSQFVFMRFTFFCNANYDFQIDWSMDGINTDISESESLVGGTSNTSVYTVKAKYIQITYNTAAGTQWRTQCLFCEASSSSQLLDNVGSGAELYITANHKVRTVTCSDGSLGITQNALEVDVVNNSPASSVTLTSAGGSTLVTDGVGPSLGIKGLTAGTGISLAPGANDITISSSGSVTVAALDTNVQVAGGPAYTVGVGKHILDSIYFTDATPAYSGATRNVYISGGGIAISHGSTNDSVGIGYNCMRSSSSASDYNVAIGSESLKTTGVSNDMVAVGYYTQPTTTAEGITIIGAHAGDGSVMGQYSILLGWSAGEFGTVGTDAIAIGKLAGKGSLGNNAIVIGGSPAINCPASAIQIGHGCAAPGAVGRLAFGNAMEALKTTASSTTYTVPQRCDGFIPIEYNGTLYHIPAFLP